MPAHAARSARGPSRDIDAKETDADVEIVEEGETPRPVPATAKGQPDLTPLALRILCLFVTFLL